MCVCPIDDFDRDLCASSLEFIESLSRISYIYIYIYTAIDAVASGQNDLRLYY